MPDFLFYLDVFTEFLQQSSEPYLRHNKKLEVHPKKLFEGPHEKHAEDNGSGTVQRAF
jgi:hypothetical protein